MRSSAADPPPSTYGVDGIEQLGIGVGLGQKERARQLEYVLQIHAWSVAGGENQPEGWPTLGQGGGQLVAGHAGHDNVDHSDIDLGGTLVENGQGGFAVGG